eukprot:INCI16530.1.p1 GENE.INCI16530.1~~INCI16530.1.p1  ORF type:complete len:312 (+),score=87.66 INCI16530.1:348-1283(+)
MGAGGSTGQMGNSDSKAGGGGGADLSSPKNPEDKQKISKLAKADSTEIDPRIAKYLVERLKSPNREKSFMRIILKLPSIGDKFVKLQKAFEQFDSNGDGVIDEKELAGALKVLGANINEGQVRDIFASADVHTQNGLNIKSFIISLSLAYLFGVVPVQKDGSVQLSVMTSADQQGIKEAFAAGADMFLLFDEDAGGTITLDEVVSVLSKMGRNDLAKKSTKNFSTGNNLTSLYLERFKEFDWDSDGRITFSEFLFAFIGWTDVEELIEEENEASGAAKAAAAAPAAAKVEDAPAAAKSEDAPAATSEAAAE